MRLDTSLGVHRGDGDIHNPWDLTFVQMWHTESYSDIECAISETDRINMGLAGLSYSE